MDIYLKECSEKVKSRLWQSVKVVLGNESADLDSVICTLTFAYFLEKHNIPEEIVLPIINTSRASYHLRKDISFVLNSTFGFDVEPFLIFFDELNLSDDFQSGKLKLVLVDHSVLASSQINLSPAIVQIIDHHSLNDNTILPSQADNRIQKVGSCCTLITETILDTDDSFLNEKYVALLLLAAILVDTDNFNLKSGKTTNKDISIGQRLKKSFLHDLDTETFYDSIISLRRDISGLTILEILEKDYKSIKNSQISIGTSTVLTSISKFLEKTLNITKELEDFCSNKKVDIAVILFVNHENNLAGTQRQIAVFSKNEIYRNQVLDCLLTDEHLADLRLDKYPDIVPDIAAFDQGNASMSRKQILPILENFLSGFTKQPPDAAFSTPLHIDDEIPKSSARQFVETHGLAKCFSVTYDDSAIPSRDFSPEDLEISPLSFTESMVHENGTEAKINQTEIDYTTSDKPNESMLQEFVSDAIEHSQMQLDTEENNRLNDEFDHSVVVNNTDSNEEETNDKNDWSSSAVNIAPNNVGSIPQDEYSIHLETDDAEMPKTPPNTFAHPFGAYMDENLLSPAKLREAFADSTESAKISCPPTPPNSYMNTPKLLHETETKFEAQLVENELRKLSKSMQDSEEQQLSSTLSIEQKQQLPENVAAPSILDTPTITFSGSSVADVKSAKPPAANPLQQYHIPQVQLSDSESEFAGFTPRSNLTSAQWADDDYPELLEIYEDDPSKQEQESNFFKTTNVADRRVAVDIADERSEKGDELEWENDTPLAAVHGREQSDEFNLAASDLAEERRWKNVTIGGTEYRIDASAVEPFRKVVTHGGYYGDGLNAVVVFAACYLPSRSLANYHYLMDNLFLYTVSVLDAVVAEDYVIIFLQGGATGDQMPAFSWLRKCYRLIDSRHVSFTEPNLDRRLKKNLKRLLLVHATLWLKTVITMTKPFISSKFSKKISFIQSLEELSKVVPLDQVSVPDAVSNYDKNKMSSRRQSSKTVSET